MADSTSSTCISCLLKHTALGSPAEPPVALEPVEAAVVVDIVVDPFWSSFSKISFQ